jgi:hypothetical protein
MRADLDAFLGHDQGAIHESEIADGAGAVFADGKGTAGVTGNVIAEDDGARRLAFEVAKDLRGLAIETVTEDDVGGDRLGPPIALDSSLLIDVAHEG